MTDFRPMNEQIADLLQRQTYDERMELAAWFCDPLKDQKADMEDGEGFTAAGLAVLFSLWAETELTEDTP